MANNYTVASADQLRGLEHVKIDDVEEQGFNAAPEMNKGKLPANQVSTAGKAVHFTPSTGGASEDDSSSPGTEVFTHSRHASWSTNSPVSAIPESLPTFQAPYETELLRPARYGEAVSPLDPEFEGEQSHVSVQRNEALSTLSNGHSRNTSRNHNDLALDTTGHMRSDSESSNRGRKQKDDLYFTPTDVTKSKIFFTSPKGSPTLPLDQVVASGSATSRPAINIPAGNASATPSPVPRRRDTLKITPAQLDQLVTALAKSRMIQKHVRKYWWDAEDIPDDETVTSIETVSTPTLTTASTLYSRRNENFIDERYTPDGLPDQTSAQDFATRPLPPPPSAPTSGGIALTDPKIHGSPIRFISKNFRLGSKGLSIGSCSFLNIPYGTEVECTLHVHQGPNPHSRSKIMLQCVNQVVERKTGARKFLLAAEIDVTNPFTTATLAEFASLLSKPVSEIEVVHSPTSGLPIDSPEVDWVALADTLQANAHISDSVENTLAAFTSLTTSTCTAQTTSLLSHLDQLKDQHTDFIILKPTAFHENGVPSNIRLPWVSQRLYHDWYETAAEHGKTENAEEFKTGIVSEVAKHVAERGEGAGKFSTEVKWGETGMVVLSVPVSETVGGRRADAWVCFVRGESEVI